MLALIAALLLLTNAFGQRCDPGRPGQRIQDCPMPSVSAGPDPIQLRFTTMTTVFPTVSLTTRVFALGNAQPTLPAPFIHIKRGQTFQVELHNDLVRGSQIDRNTKKNGFGDANTTNLHLHGLHIDSKSPGDDMSIKVPPSDKFTYTYKISNDHAAGLFLWHTHHHGSVSLQFAGGAVGLLVLEDDELNCPQGFLQTLQSTFLLVQRIQPAEIQDFQLLCNDDIKNDIKDLTEFYIVNGLITPIITLPRNRWHRLRISHASVAISLDASIPGCDMVLLAIDGVYLFTPRVTTYMEFHPASRADIAIRCPAAASITDEVGSVIANIEVVDNMTGPETIDLTAWKWNRPSYLPDLRKQPVAAKWFADVDLYQPLINRRTFKGMDRKMALTEARVGTVQEWKFESSAHPMHLHVYHMQLAEDASHFYKAGDYVDQIKGSGIVVRVFFDRFDGPAMIHCHVLRHEDQGLMGHIWVHNDSVELNKVDDPSSSSRSDQSSADSLLRNWHLLAWAALISLLFTQV